MTALELMLQATADKTHTPSTIPWRMTLRSVLSYHGQEPPYGLSPNSGQLRIAGSVYSCSIIFHLTICGTYVRIDQRHNYCLRQYLVFHPLHVRKRPKSINSYAATEMKHELTWSDAPSGRPAFCWPFRDEHWPWLAEPPPPLLGG